MVDEVRFSLVSISLLPVRGKRPETVVIRRVRMSAVSVVFGDVALPTAAAVVVRADTCNGSGHDSVHFVHIVVVVVVLVLLQLVPRLLLAAERLETARHGHDDTTGRVQSC